MIVELQAMGSGAVYAATKAIVIANGFLEPERITLTDQLTLHKVIRNRKLCTIVVFTFQKAEKEE